MMFWSTWFWLRILVFVHRGLPYFANVRYLEKKALWHRFEAGFWPVGSSKPKLFQNCEHSKTTVRTVNDVLSHRSKQTFAILVSFDWWNWALSQFFKIVTCSVTFFQYRDMHSFITGCHTLLTSGFLKRKALWHRFEAGFHAPSRF